MGNRELVALLNLSSWCLVMVKRLFLAVLQGCLQFVIVVFPEQTHLIFLITLARLGTSQFMFKHHFRIHYVPEAHVLAQI